MCGAGRDTLRHRCWECQHPDITRRRAEHFGTELVQQALECDENILIVSWLWPAYPDVPPPSKDWCLQFFGAQGEPVDAFVFGPEARLFTDGSCFHNTRPEIA
eukprot:6916999-Pyramimonas_sp.AAC.1